MTNIESDQEEWDFEQLDEFETQYNKNRNPDIVQYGKVQQTQQNLTYKPNSALPSNQYGTSQQNLQTYQKGNYSQDSLANNQYLESNAHNTQTYPYQNKQISTDWRSIYSKSQQNRGSTQIKPCQLHQIQGKNTNFSTNIQNIQSQSQLNSQKKGTLMFNSQIQQTNQTIHQSGKAINQQPQQLQLSTKQNQANNCQKREHQSNVNDFFHKPHLNFSGRAKQIADQQILEDLQMRDQQIDLDHWDYPNTDQKQNSDNQNQDGQTYQNTCEISPTNQDYTNNQQGIQSVTDRQQGSYLNFDQSNMQHNQGNLMQKSEENADYLASSYDNFFTPEKNTTGGCNTMLENIDLETVVNVNQNQQDILGTCVNLDESIKLNRSKAKNWILPTNEEYQLREYQFKIIQTSLFNNTLVCLPTGLGKTFIASVVMYNFQRWFEEGKVIFVAPTKPLVCQQLEQCQKYTQLTKFDIAEMTGNVTPEIRQSIWEQKKIFFCTPQALENDLKKGICPSKSITCLVIDECHRATGTSKNPYVNMVKILNDDNVKFRVVGLSASPGKNQDTIQQVISNTMISKIELRNEEDPDIKKYVYFRNVQIHKVVPCERLDNVEKLLNQVLQSLLQELIRNGFIRYLIDVDKITRFWVMNQRWDLLQRQRNGKFQTQKNFHELFKFTESLANLKEQLESSGITVAQELLKLYLRQKYVQESQDDIPGYIKYFN